MEAEPPKVTPMRKGKKKLFVEEVSESEWEEDVDTAIEEAISIVARTEEVRSSLRDLITSITTEEPPTVTPAQAATQQILTTSCILTRKVSSKQKGAQPFVGTTAPEEPKHNKTRTIQLKVTEVAGTPPISPIRSQKKKPPITVPLSSPKEHQRSGSKKT